MNAVPANNASRVVISLDPGAVYAVDALLTQLSVPFVRLGREDNAIAQLHGAGFALAATVVRNGTDLFDAGLPQRLVYVLGAEGEGMSPTLAAACDMRVSIPGSGCSTATAITTSLRRSARR